MVETVEKLTEDCSSVKIQNIPVIFIEDRDDEVSERIMNGFDHYSPSVRIVNITKPSLDAVGGFGFLLSRSKWDPYPYVSKIDEGSPASSSGIKEGDCVLEVREKTPKIVNESFEPEGKEEEEMALDAVIQW